MLKVKYIRCQSIDKVGKIVNAHITLGWKPRGPTVVDASMFIQCIEKKYVAFCGRKRV